MEQRHSAEQHLGLAVSGTSPLGPFSPSLPSTCLLTCKPSPDCPGTRFSCSAQVAPSPGSMGAAGRYETQVMVTRLPESGWAVVSVPLPAGLCWSETGSQKVLARRVGAMPHVHHAGDSLRESREDRRGARKPVGIPLLRPAAVAQCTGLLACFAPQPPLSPCTPPQAGP